MATNYLAKEAVQIITENKDQEAIQEIGKRFPFFAIAIAKATAGNPDAAFLLGFIPDHITAGKMNKDMKAVLLGEDSEEEAEEAAPAKKENKSGKKAKAEPEPDEEEVEDDEDEEEVVNYKKMKATELFKLCKKRKIKVAPKKDQKYYIEKLEEADAEAESDDDWDEEEEKKPAKKEKKAAKGKGGKKAKAAEEDDDEDWEI